MVRTVRFWVFLILLVVAAAAAVFMFYLPVPRPVEEPEYREIVRDLRFTGTENLKEWDEKRLAKNSTRYAIEESEGRSVLKADSENSASGLYLKERLSFRNRPYVKWEWKVLKFPARNNAESIETKSEFDFAAQLYVIFHSRAIMKTRAIQYVWAETLPEGTWSKSPYTGNVRILVLESGGSGEWKTEERDIAKDYSDLFGEKLDKDVDAIGFMTDSDSTGTKAEALLAYVDLGYLPSADDGSSEKQEGSDFK